MCIVEYEVVELVSVVAGTAIIIEYKITVLFHGLGYSTVSVGGMVITNYPVFGGRLAKKNLPITDFYFIVGKIILYVTYVNTTNLMYACVPVYMIGAR